MTYYGLLSDSCLTLVIIAGLFPRVTPSMGGYSLCYSVGLALAG